MKKFPFIFLVLVFAVSVGWRRSRSFTPQNARLVTTSLINLAVGVNLTGTYPVWIPPDVVQANWCLANYDVFNGAATTDLVNISLGIGPSNGDNTYVGSPTIKQTGVTIPGNGSYYCTGLFTVPRGSDGQTVLAIAIPAGQNLAATTVNLTWGGRSVAVAQVDPLPIPLTPNGSNFPAMYLTYSTVATPVTVNGDSIAIAYNATNGATLGVNASAWFELGYNNHYAVDVTGVPGVTLTQWMAGHPGLSAQQIYDGTIDFDELGLNDIGTGTTGAALKAQTITYAATLKAAGAHRVYIETFAPCAAYAAQNAERLNWNTLVRADAGSGGWANVDGFVDLDLVWRDPGNTNQLNPAYDSGDGCHPNISGHQAANPILLARIQAGG